MTKEYKVGMIGFGFIGKVHAYGHLNIPMHYDQQDFRSRITHICTGHIETAEKGCAMVGAEHAVTDFREITENPDIDIVDICSPNDKHYEAIMSAIAHGKHIYCDKPLTQELSDGHPPSSTTESCESSCQRQRTSESAISRLKAERKEH